MSRTVDPVLRWPAVKETTGLPRSTAYLKISRNEFPRPLKLGDRSVGWLASEVDAWVRTRDRKAA